MKDTTPRVATLGDLDTLVLHRRRMWEHMGEGHSPRELDAADGPYRAWAEPRLADGTLHGVIIEDATGAPVASGCVWLQPIQPRPGAPTLQPYILSMYTEPHARGHGHARRIVDALVSWSHEKGYRSITLHAAPKARALYEQAGFGRTWEMRLASDD